MGQIGRGPPKIHRQVPCSRVNRGRRGRLPRLKESAYVFTGCRLIDRHADGVHVHAPDVEAPIEGCCDECIGTACTMDAHRIEEAISDDPQTHGVATSSDLERMSTDTIGDGTKSLGTVVGGIHGSDHGQQHLGRANVARRAFTANVLLTCLQGQSICGDPIGIDRDADESTGK